MSILSKFRCDENSYTFVKQKFQKLTEWLQLIKRNIIILYSVMEAKVCEAVEVVSNKYPHEYTFEDANRNYERIKENVYTECPLISKLLIKLCSFWPYLLLGVFLITVGTTFAFGEATEDFQVLPGPFYRGHPSHLVAKMKKKEM